MEHKSKRTHTNILAYLTFAYNNHFFISRPRVTVEEIVVKVVV